MFLSKTADHLVPTICLVMSCVIHLLCWVSVQSLCLPVAMQIALFNSNGPFLSALQLERYKPGRGDVKVHFNVQLEGEFIVPMRAVGTFAPVIIISFILLECRFSLLAATSTSSISLPWFISS